MFPMGPCATPATRYCCDGLTRPVLLAPPASSLAVDAFFRKLTGDSRVIAVSESTIGRLFAAIPGLKKGDALLVDWVPGTGTVCTLNGRKIGETVPDLAFYNAILRIWIGNEPADTDLKPKLLGG